MGWHDPLLQTEGGRRVWGLSKRRKQERWVQLIAACSDTLVLFFSPHLIFTCITRGCAKPHMMTCNCRKQIWTESLSPSGVDDRATLHDLQEEKRPLIHRLLFRPQGYTWTFTFSPHFSLYLFIFPAIDFHVIGSGLPERMPLIAGMASGSQSFTGVSWKENKQAECSTADEWGDAEWEWVWESVRQRQRDTKNKKNY